MTTDAMTDHANTGADWQTSIQCPDACFPMWFPDAHVENNVNVAPASCSSSSLIWSVPAGESERAAAFSHAGESERATALSALSLPDLSVLYPDLDTGLFVERGRITRVMYQNDTQCPVAARVMLFDPVSGGEYNVRGRFNGFDPELLDYGGHVMARESLTYIRAYPKKMYAASAAALIQIIGQRTIANASSNERVESDVHTFLHEAQNATKWETVTERYSFDILWWLVSQKRRKREWAATILDCEATKLFWIHHLCPEILLYRSFDTVKGLDFSQLVDLKQQFFEGWTDQFLRQTWVSTQYDSAGRRMRPIRNPNLVSSDQCDPCSFGAAVTDSDYPRTNIRVESAQALPVVTLEHLAQIYRHVATAEGSTTIRKTMETETKSFHIALHVLMKDCPPETFMMMAYMELFVACLEGSTMMPRLYPVGGGGCTSLRPLKSVLRFDEPFLASIELLSVLCTPNCKTRFATIAYLYHFIYWNHPDYREDFGSADEEGNLTWPMDAQRACLLALVRKRAMLVFSNEYQGKVYIMTRDALEHALFYRHELVQFVARAEDLQTEQERVIQFMDPDSLDYSQLHPQQKNVFTQLQTRKKFLILLLGPGGTGKTRTAQCFHLVEPEAGRAAVDLEPYRAIHVPRLLEPTSRRTGLQWVRGQVRGLSPSHTLSSTAQPHASLLDEFDDPWEDVSMSSLAPTASAGTAASVPLSSSFVSLAAPSAVTASSSSSSSSSDAMDTDMPPLDMPYVDTLFTPLRQIYPMGAGAQGAPPPPTPHPPQESVGALPPQLPPQGSEGAPPPRAEPPRIISSGKQCITFLVPMLSQRADASRRLGVQTQTYAHVATKVVHGIGKTMRKSLVLLEDEVSMQSNAQSIGLLRGMRQMDLVANIKLGDTMQLPSVEPGNLLQDLYDMKTCYEKRKRIRAKRIASGLTVSAAPPPKTRTECLRTDDLEFLCERVHLEELTVNHRVDSDSASLLPFLDMIRNRKCDDLMRALGGPAVGGPAVGGPAVGGPAAPPNPPAGPAGQSMGESEGTKPPPFVCMPLGHPDGGFSDMEVTRRLYSDEHRTLMDMFDAYREKPYTYQILVSTNACRNYINAFLAQHAGYTMKLEDKYHAMAWAQHGFGSNSKFESDLIVRGSLRVQTNMKILFQSDFTQDVQTMHANTIFVVSSVVRVPFFMLNACAARHAQLQKQKAPQEASKGTSTVSSVNAKAGGGGVGVAAGPSHLHLLTWRELQLCMKIEKSVEPKEVQTREHVYCTIIRNQSSCETLLHQDDVASPETFFVVRTTDAFYRHINLATACTMHYMQGLQIDHVKIIMERASERRLNQKVMITATGRAKKTVAVYVQNARSVMQACQQFVEAVRIQSPHRWTVLGEILQDHFAISLDTMDALLA